MIRIVRGIVQRTTRWGPRLGTLLGAAAGAAFALVGAPASSQVAYSETVSGDLSNNGLSPTVVSLLLGDNLVSGTTGKNAAGVIDRDYFTITLAPDEALDAIVLQPGTTTLGTLGFSFIGVQSGGTVTVLPTATSAAGLLGWTHYDQSEIGTDILDNMGVPANNSTGFTPPLGAGSYTFWVQEASTGSVNYAFDFHVAAIPEPSSWAMLLLGFGAIGLAMRQRRGLQPSQRRCL